MIKKLLLSALALSLVFGATVLTGGNIFSDQAVIIAEAEDDYWDGYYEILDDGTVEITYCRDSGATEIVIPSEIDGMSVTSIGKGAFFYCNRLKTVTIPDSVTKIGDKAFSNCFDLENVIMSEGVTSIGAYAFEWCDSLINITIPDSVTSIGAGAFDRTPWLESIRDKNSLAIVNGILIDGRYSKGDLIIPGNVTDISDYAFGGLFNYTEELTSVTIPDSVTSIGEGVFCHCTALKSVYLPDNLTSIGEDAFYNCRSLTNINIPDSVEQIGANAFSDCNSLTHITIPKSVTQFGEDVFKWCDKLTIYCFKDSAAQQYAIENEFDYVLLDDIPAPTVKSTYTNTSSAIRINWNKVEGASGYKIFRYNTSTKRYELAGKVNNNTTFNYLDSGLKDGTKYQYQVQAFINDGTNTYYYSPNSSTITAWTKPATPKVKTTYTCTTSAIRINWDKVTGASGYKIFRYDESKKAYVLIGKVNNNTTFNYLDNNCKAGTTYKYQVQAFKNKGDNTYLYSTMSSTIAASTKPATPKVKTSYTCTSSAIRVNWNKVTGASGYKIFRYDPSKKTYVLIGKVNNNTTFNYLDKNCKAGTTYKYQVQAFKNKGNNTYLYSTMSSTITAATKPAATKITKNTQAKTAVRLYWNKVSCTGYKIQQYKNGQWVTIKKVAMGTTNYRVDGLKANTSYKFRIQPYYTVNGKILYGAVSAIYTAKTSK